jgi:hypothetical protein
VTAAVLACLCLAPTPLCARLSDRSFRARESAQRALAWLGRLAVPALLAAEADPPDAETQRRCRHLLAPYWEGLCRRTVARWRPLPWLDRHVAARFESVPECVYERYEREGKGLRDRQYAYPDRWSYYRAATELLCRDLLARGLPAARVLHLLGRLAAAEYDWHAAQKNFTRPR